uniref:NADH dehydrogenase subunit 4L n=1 Tax=Erpetoichthys calabaricus TaxID=27687 RepID=A0A8C4S0V1_ERPCA
IIPLHINLLMRILIFLVLSLTIHCTHLLSALLYLEGIILSLFIADLGLNHLHNLNLLQC